MKPSKEIVYRGTRVPKSGDGGVKNEKRVNNIRERAMKFIRKTSLTISSYI
jgi:hypothetical protein